MVDKATKTVKVDQSKAEKWDEYVEENGYVDSVSHLIRLSVNNHIEGENDIGRTQADASNDSGNPYSGEVLTALRGIQTGIEDLEERMTALEEVESAEAGYDLQKAIYSFLPTEKDSLDYDDWAMTSPELSRKLGADEGDVVDALERLEEVTGQVGSVTGGPDNTTYWFKRGEE